MRHTQFVDSVMDIRALQQRQAIIGYDADGCVDYWKVKHSWERPWCKPGFIRLPRAMVGLASAVFFLVYPLTQYCAEQTLDFLCDLGVQFGTFARQLRWLCHCFQLYMLSICVTLRSLRVIFLGP